MKSRGLFCLYFLLVSLTCFCQTPIPGDINQDGIVDHEDLYVIQKNWHSGAKYTATPIPTSTPIPTMTPTPLPIPTLRIEGSFRGAPAPNVVHEVDVYLTYGSILGLFQVTVRAESENNLYFSSMSYEIPGSQRTPDSGRLVSIWGQNYTFDPPGNQEILFTTVGFHVSQSATPGVIETIRIDGSFEIEDFHEWPNDSERIHTFSLEWPFEILMPFGTEIESEVSASGEADDYGFEVLPDYTYDIIVIPGTLHDSELALLNPEKTPIAENDDGKDVGLGSRITWTADVSDVFYARVTGIGERAGNYVLSIEKQSPTPTVTSTATATPTPTATHTPTVTKTPTQIG